MYVRSVSVSEPGASDRYCAGVSISRVLVGSSASAPK